MSGPLKGKVAVVLGAAGAGNMGQIIALKLIAEGARLFVAGRHEDELERFALGQGADHAVCDITDPGSIASMAETIKAKAGGVDIAVNAVGWGLLKPFELTTDDELQRMIDIQFTGPWRYFRAMLGIMRDGGSLIQISSATATIMLDDHAAYMGTKAGFDHVMRCLALEYGPRGIRANSISPGLTDTPMTANAKKVPGLFELYRKSYPLGRVGTSEDIAEAVAWLSSDGCFMTGQTLQVNGGLTLRGNPSRDEMDAAVSAKTGKPRPRPWEIRR